MKFKRCSINSMIYDPVDKPKQKFVHYFIGHKFNGVRSLNSAIGKSKLRCKKLEDTIENIKPLFTECSVVQFEDSNSVYVGSFIHLNDISEMLIKTTKEYKDVMKKIETDYNKIGMTTSNVIIENSIKMR